MKMNALPTYTLDRFDWNSQDRFLVTEASDLRRGHPFGRVWSDACDEGLTVRNSKTGGCETFIVDREIRSENQDRELQGWVLKPYKIGSKVKSLVIYND